MDENSAASAECKKTLPCNRNQFRLWLPLNILAVIAGIGLTVWCYNPGYIDYDSLWQLNEARRHQLDVVHPPLSSFIWGWFDSIIPGPFLMFLFHNLLFWIGLGLVIGLSLEGSFLSPFIIFGIGFYPVVSINLGTIWKDTSMAGSLLLCCGLLLLARRNRSKLVFAGALVSLYYALAVRHDAFVAVFPMAVWMGWIIWELFCPDTAVARRKRLFSGVVIFFLLWILVGATNKALAPQGVRFVKSLPWSTQTVFIHDLAAVSVATGHVQMPAYLHLPDNEASLRYLEKLYAPEDVYPLFWVPPGTRAKPLRLPLSRDPKQLEELFLTWKKVIPAHLPAYFRHRWEGFNVFMGAQGKLSHYLFVNERHLKLIGIPFKPSPLNTRMMGWLSSLSKTVLFKGWFYFSIIAVLLFLAVLFFSEYTALSVILGAGAVLRMPIFFFFSGSPYFHYHFWTVCTALVMLVILPAQLLAARRAAGKVLLAKKGETG